MLVNAVKERCDASTGWETKHYREQVEIPEGAWAVIIKVQTNPGEGLDGCVYRSDNTKVEVVGTRLYEEVVIKRSWDSYYLNETIVFWSRDPFVVIESWESPMDGKWVHMACRVSKRGLSKTLPKLTLPSFYSSRTGQSSSDKRTYKWCRLTELAKLLGVKPAQLIEWHKDHFQGYVDAGVHVVRAVDVQTLRQTEGCECVWTAGETDELIGSDLENVWVRRRFALVASYFKLIGWHAEEAKVT